MSDMKTCTNAEIAIQEMNFAEVTLRDYVISEVQKLAKRISSMTAKDLINNASYVGKPVRLVIVPALSVTVGGETRTVSLGDLCCIDLNGQILQKIRGDELEPRHISFVATFLVMYILASKLTPREVAVAARCITEGRVEDANVSVYIHRARA